MSALGVVVALVAVVALKHPDGWSAGRPAAKIAPARSPSTHTPTSVARTSPAATGASRTPTPTPSTSSVKLPLVVVNSTGASGLAAAGADTFRAGGWVISLLANYVGPIQSSCAYYDPAVPHAQDAALGLQRQFPAIRRVAARFEPLPAGPVVVVLAADYSGDSAAAPSSGQRDTGAVR